MFHQLRLHPLLHQGLVDPLAQSHPGKFRKSPGKGGFRGNIAPPHKTADAPQDRRSPQGLDGSAGVAVVIDRLAHKGPGQGRAFPRLAAEPFGKPDGKFLDLENLQNAD